MTLRPSSLAASASWAVLDHALFSLGGMVTSLLLARGMSAHAYGAYAVSFSVYMAVFVVHGALFVEPMLVLAAHRFRARIGSYLRAVLVAHGLFALLAFVVVSGVALVVLRAGDQAELRGALIAMAIAAPFMNLAQLLRRLCYALWTPREAAIGGLAYAVMVSGAIVLLVQSGELGLGTAYAALGGSSLLASCGWLWRAAVARDALTVGDEVAPRGEAVARQGAVAREQTRDAVERLAGPLTLRRVVGAHFAFARYGLGTALLGWVPLNVWYVALPVIVAGEAELGTSGHLRALVNLMQPMLQVSGALATLLVPTFTRQLRDTRSASPWRFVSIMTVIAAVYAPLLALLGPWLDRWLYRGVYPADAATWWALGLVPACFAFYAGLRSFCVANEKPQLPLVATVVSSLGCLTLGLALCLWRPLLGASLGMLTGFALQAAVLAWLVRACATAA